MTGEADARLVTTSGGTVETVVRGEADPAREPILYFHGGHESAVTAAAADVYVELGHRVVRVSRPGYGRTEVGPLAPSAFAALVDEVRVGLGIEVFTAVVGTSFGGPQAVEYAGQYPGRARALILHSAAPSSLPYPDSAAQRRFAPMVFHPLVERQVWGAVRLLMRVAPTFGLGQMMSSLSTQPVSTWLPLLGETDRRAMRDVFAEMRSGHGFVTDLAHAGAEGRENRLAAQRHVTCPTLVTASRSDGGVAWVHAEDLVATIARAHLVELPSPSHLFWIGPGRAPLLAAVQEFLAGLTDGAPSGP